MVSMVTTRSSQQKAKLRDYSAGEGGCRYLREFKQNTTAVRILDRKQARLSSLLTIFTFFSLNSICERGQRLTVVGCIQNQC